MPAAAADAAMAAQLAAGALRFEGLAVEVESARLAASAGAEATVEIAYVVGAHAAVEGEAEHPYPRQRYVAELDLVWGATGWRVERARPQ